MNKVREVKQVVNGVKSSDGDGVQLTRIIGSSQLEMLDPFLLFDFFGSDKPQDYIGGFPSHPHRGFETVTYMLAGKMRHQDSSGNSGVIETGGVQWMTAGRGIIHSEMPEQENGLLSGFQLWVNLPASHKMIKPKYQEKVANEIPEDVTKEKTSIKVIAGITSSHIKGVIENEFTKPTYWDVRLAENSQFIENVPASHNSFIYLIKGKILVGNNGKSIVAGQLAVLQQGESIKINSESNSRFLVVAALPLNEPIARAGPFVMNTSEEIHQAFADYQSGNFIS